MWPLRITDTLHGNDMFPVNTNEGRKAGIDTGMVYLFRRRVILRDHDRTSSTPSFRAAQFRARETNATKVLEKGYLRIDRLEYDAGAVEMESQR